MSVESNTSPIYEDEKVKQKLYLSPEQQKAVRNITLGIEEVDETVRAMAVDDVIKTLQNGHPLNRIISNKEGKTTGYIACEDFTPREAYIKYFGTNKSVGMTGRNLFKEIPAFFEYATQQGYTKLNFHGWNERLNHVLEHFGFKRLRTDSIGPMSADFYEKSLTKPKSLEKITEEREKAFEQKYINKINNDYQQTLATFSQENRQRKEQLINNSFDTLSNRLGDVHDFKFNDLQKVTLKLKLARYFQKNNNIDVNTLFDAIVESPRFLATDKGSLHKLFEVHEVKTLEKIAEIRKQRAEIKGDEGLNPYEALFTTKSGDYYMARLLNMPHLQEESEYMEHCVGTSDSYINKIKRGEVEIISFRHTPKINPSTQRLEGDTPIITIEYNLRTKTIEQMKKYDDKYLETDDPYYNDVIDALKQLRKTKTDTGELRDFKKISSSELKNIEVTNYHFLTEHGEVSLVDFDPSDNAFILKTGYMGNADLMSREYTAKIIQFFEGFKCEPQQIARNIGEISSDTRVYIGRLYTGYESIDKNIFTKLADIEHVYTSMPGKKISRGEITTTGKSGDELEKELKDKKVNIDEYSDSMIQSEKFIVHPAGENIPTVRLRVCDLFPDGNGHDYNEIIARAKELSLDVLPHETALDILLKEETQPKLDESFCIASEMIRPVQDLSYVLRVGRDDDGLKLGWKLTSSSSKWDSDSELLFGLHQVSRES